MSGLESDTVGGFNGFVEEEAKLAGTTKVTTVLFDDKYEVLWEGRNALDAVMAKSDYFTRGSTALLDAIGKSIRDVGLRLSLTEKDKRPGKVIMVITTDGLENASHLYDYEMVKRLITHQEEKYGWEFIFMGANIDVECEAGRLGIASENAYAYEASEKGTLSMFAEASACLKEIW